MRRRLVAVAALTAAVLSMLVLVSGGDPGPSSPRPVASVPVVAHRAVSAGRRSLAAALRRGVAEAEQLGGEVEAAAMLDSWHEPLARASRGDGSSRRMRMWSISKVVTMVALLRAHGWGEKPGEPLPAEVDVALRDAITRSENCPQRRVTLELQKAVGGSPERVREAIEETLAAAGAEADVGSQVTGPDPNCLDYLQAQSEIDDPMAPTVLLGISTWRIVDAVRFARALGAGVYGRALTGRALGLMRAPKLPSRDVEPGEYTVPADWGAGRELAALDPAYKAGWGGVTHGAFMAAQVAIVDLPGRRRAAVAVAFHPDRQPSLDDPGRTAAPEAIELVMDRLEPALAASR